jgi:hypothetical protein
MKTHINIHVNRMHANKKTDQRVLLVHEVSRHHQRPARVRQLVGLVSGLGSRLVGGLVG